MERGVLSERWSAEALKRLDQLLDHALTLNESERKLWLRSLTGPDADLHEPLSRMLDDLEREREFMAHPVGAATLNAVAEEIGGDAAGDSLGNYQLQRKLGAGGMSVVWLARDLQRVINREVALKLPMHAWQPETSARMKQEWTILASLEHPGIARLYDAGWLPDGRPFLAMEFVDGVPIDRHVRQDDLPVEDIVGLVAQVADALAYAHARLVVHRDIKPSNIMVDRAGRVRLLDFGVARLLEGSTVSRSELTRAGGQMLTPGYASPEQIAGQPLTVATDVFSLGVVLYELLAERRPHRPLRDTPAALEDAILQGDLQPASKAARNAQRRARLKGDLDAILQKALQKNPVKRYATMSAFADDLRAFLDGRPVTAQPERWRYRARKFVGRHRIAVSAAALFAITLVMGVAATLWQAGVAREQAEVAARERDPALQELRYAQATEEFTRLILSEGLAQQLPATESLRRGEQNLREQFASQPGLRGRLQLALAQLYSELEDQGRRTAMIAEARESATLSQDPILQDAVQCVAAGDHFTQGRHGQAMELFKSAIDRSQQRVDRSGFALQICLTERSGALRVMGQWQAALADARQALSLLDADSPGNYSKVIGLRSQLADALTLSGDFDGAVESHRALVTQYFGSGRGRTVLGLYVVNHHVLALARAGQTLEAMNEYQRLLNLMGLEVNNTYSALIHNHARLLISMERFAEARQEMQRMRRMQGNLRNRSMGLFSGALVAMTVCGERLWQQCLLQIDEAESHIHAEGLERHSIRATLLWLRAWAAAGRGDHVSALKFTDQSIATYQAANDRNPYLVRARVQRAQSLAALERVPEALEESARAVADARRFAEGFRHSEWVGRALRAQGAMQLRLQDARSAVASLDEARSHLSASLGNDSLPTKEAYTAWIHAQTQAQAQAQRQQQRLRAPGDVPADPHG